MKKIMILLCALVMTVFCLMACNADTAAETTGDTAGDTAGTEAPLLEKPLTSQEAEAIAVAQVGFTVDEVADIVTHVGEYQEKDCYSVRFSIADKAYEFVIEVATGAILYP